jgi:hypothetical protein
MKRLAISLALLALAACTPRAASGCNLSYDRDVAFTAADAQDVVTARAFGPSCDKAVGVFTVSSADGHPLWSWTAPMTQAFGDTFVGANADAMRAFLERWSQPTLLRTSAAPAWPLSETARTTLDRLTYEDIRARNLPMLCHSTGTGVEACVFWEPAAAGAGHMYDRDV